MTIAAEFPVYRSEAFAEDVLDLVAAAPVVEPMGQLRSRWWLNAMPATVALLSAAFTVAPPRG